MSHDTWLHRVSRYIAQPLVATPVTPNHLTTGRLLAALAAAACFAADSRPLDVAGSVLFLLSMLLDRADGVLARLQNSSSRFGAFYDLVTDAISNASVFIAFGVAAAGRVPGAVALGIVAGAAIALILTLVITTEARFGHGSAAFEARAGFDPDDAMLAIPIGVIAGLKDLLLVGAAVITPLVAVVIARVLLRRRRETR
jgi:phosphatidylglycerophosphate synthase